MAEQQRRGPLSIPPPELGRKKVGRYEVICPMAQGGMANIHIGRLASMAGFERLVAIKVIHPMLAEDPAFVKMFLDEARLAAGIHHPNVGEIFEVGEDDGIYFMVGELIKGQSIRALFRRAKLKDIKVTHNVAAYIASQICLGAQSAHDLVDQDGVPLKMIHRDISPRNILISYDGYVKLIDFGVAWAKGRDGEDSTGDALKGKIGFMPPEQIKGEPPMDQRSDLFSLGIVMYMMVTGKHPFSGKTEAERLRKMLHSEIEPPRKINPALDPVLERIILTALSPKMEDRYDTAADMGYELEEYLRRIGKKVTPQVLSEVMHRAFGEEIEAQETLLRKYRREQDDLSRKIPLKRDHDQANGAPVTAEEVSAKLPEKQEKAWLPLAAGVVAVIIAFLAGFFVSRTDDGPSPEVRTMVRPPALPVSPEPAQNTAPPAEDEQQEAPPEEKLVSMMLDVHPEDATVKLNGERLEPDTVLIELPADGATHVIQFSATGYATTTEEVVADRDMRLSIHLKPILEWFQAEKLKRDQASRARRKSRKKSGK